MENMVWSEPAPDDIVLFTGSELNDDWCYWGDLSIGDKIDMESRDYRIVKFESEEWKKLHEQ